MKVCAHFNDGNFHNWHERHDSISEAIDSLKAMISEVGNVKEACVDVSPQCKDCDSAMNFHDYPMARFEVGPRGGIRKVAV